ncbi:MAG: rod shape-determining protein MreC [Bacilli bacterium]|nr:rod shape-determining protein MreC [Bacilli bacterium]
MKFNYLVYILLIFSILFRNNIMNIISNVNSALFIKNDNLEIRLLKEENYYLKNKYKELLDFKNNISLENNYVISNVIKSSYGLNNLIIKGSNYEIGDEVISNDGLIGIISKRGSKNSEVDYLHNTNLVVKVNNEIGKITGSDQNNNLIIKEISNYTDIKINDYVYSVYGTYLGKVIKIKYDILDNYLTVRQASINNLNYIAVISREI